MITLKTIVDALCANLRVQPGYQVGVHTPGTTLYPDREPSHYFIEFAPAGPNFWWMRLATMYPDHVMIQPNWGLHCDLKTALYMKRIEYYDPTLQDQLQAQLDRFIDRRIQILADKTKQPGPE